MASVTVAGAGGQTVTLTYDSNTNAAIAQQLANTITSGVKAGTISPVGDSTTPPALSAGIVGEFVKQQNGFARLPAGYKAVVDNAANAVIIGSGDVGESVLAGSGSLTFSALAGSGTVVAGGGNDEVVITNGSVGNWQINLGNGDDTVVAVGPGADTISVGTGKSVITLGIGNDVITAAGNDTINAGSGASTITGIGNSTLVVYGSGNLNFVGGDGGNTVIGGQGSETLFGGKGNDFLQGGSAGVNLLQAGAGNDTLVGSSKFQGTDLFQFVKGSAGGSDLVVNGVLGDKVSLVGYGANEVQNALNTQTIQNGSVSITLSDNTKITFQGVTKLDSNDFTSR